MSFVHPELLLLLVPAALAWWFVRGAERGTQVLRALVLALLVVALAQPYLRTSATGRDLVLVVDRSRSMPDESRERALELVKLAEDARRDGDRVAIVAFGAAAAIERLPSADARFDAFRASVDADGSDVARALDAALELVPPDRPASILLLSDGEAKGRDPTSAARRAFARGVRIDVRTETRPDRADVAVERIELPDEVGAGEPFQFVAWVRADRRVEASFELTRDGRPLASGARVFEAGLNRILLRDVAGDAGVASYRLALANPSDRVPENDVAAAAMSVRGPRSILLVNDDGARSALAQVLEAASLRVVVATPEAARLDAASLRAHRAVVLENVAAGRFEDRFDALASFVRDDGGGLMLTGGKASFGAGGWFRSTLDPLLPVSMEMRREHRKLAISLCVVLDRSGSMAAPVGGGLQKMDLANLGTCAAIELLSPLDEVGVIAVDSAPNVVQELVRADDVAPILERVRRIESAGGGIYTRTGLAAAARMLEGASAQTRHVILFADAADAEEAEGVPELIAEMVKAGMSISVIALGTEADSDATFLKTVAASGGGTAYFTQDPTELPRLFAQDTLTVARATFVEERTSAQALPSLFGLGEFRGSEFPALDGYNLTYLRPGATAGVATLDEYKAPVFAFQQQGLGRAAAFTGQVGGEFGASVVAWDGFAGFFASAARWLAGQEEPAEVFVDARREGRDAVFSVEIDPAAAATLDASKLVLSARDGNGARKTLALERIGEHRFEARAALSSEALTLATLALPDGRTVRLPPVALPYSPEFEPSIDPARGERLLRRIASESGGLVDPSAAELWRGAREGRGFELLTSRIAVLALLLVVLEIAMRRLELWSFARMPQAVSERLARSRASAKAVAQASATTAVATSASPAVPSASKPSNESQPRIDAPADVSSALARARRAAGKRLDR